MLLDTKQAFEIQCRLNSKSWNYKNKLSFAKRTIEKALNLDVKFSVSFSGGKDSSALVHLVKQFDNNIPIVSQFDDCDWPEKKPYIEELIKKYNWEDSFYPVEPDFSVFEAVKTVNLSDTEICKQSHWITKEGFISVLDKKIKELECNGRFLGLRKVESIARKRNIQVRGNLYKRSDETWMCYPLSEWEAIDVFTYLVSNNIPINPCYFKNKFKTPLEIRLAWALPTPRGLGTGDIEHIKYYYPDYYYRLKEALSCIQ